jgi:hypothetical protein
MRSQEEREQRISIFFDCPKSSTEMEETKSDISEIEIDSPATPPAASDGSSSPVSDDFQASITSDSDSSVSHRSESSSDASDYGRSKPRSRPKSKKIPAYRKQTALVRKKEESEGEESETSDYDPSSKMKGKKKKKTKVCFMEL